LLLLLLLLLWFLLPFVIVVSFADADADPDADADADAAAAAILCAVQNMLLGLFPVFFSICGLFLLTSLFIAVFQENFSEMQGEALQYEKYTHPQSTNTAHAARTPHSTRSIHSTLSLHSCRSRCSACTHHTQQTDRLVLTRARLLAAPRLMQEMGSVATFQLLDKENDGR
jgi:hypothetical protein